VGWWLSGDLRLADLLGKYNCRVLFYVPKQNDEHNWFWTGPAMLRKHLKLALIPLVIRAWQSKQAGNWFWSKRSFNWLSEILNEILFHSSALWHYNNKCIELIHKPIQIHKNNELLSHRSITSFHIQLCRFSTFKLTYFKHLLKRGGF